MQKFHNIRHMIFMIFWMMSVICFSFGHALEQSAFTFSNGYMSPQTLGTNGTMELRAIAGQVFIGSSIQKDQTLSTGFWYLLPATREGKTALPAIPEWPSFTTKLQFGNKVVSLQNPQTQLMLSLKNATWVRLHLYDVQGQLVKILLMQKMSQGNKEVSISFNEIPVGVYYYRLQAGDYGEMGKIQIVP